MVTKVAIPASPGQPHTKTSLTSLLNNGAQSKSLIGTRRIFMTKSEFIFIRTTFLHLKSILVHTRRSIVSQKHACLFVRQSAVFSSGGLYMR